MLRPSGQVWGAGGTVDWAAVHGGRARRVPLPTYPFDHERYWIDPVRQADDAAGQAAPASAPAPSPTAYDRHAAIRLRLRAPPRPRPRPRPLRRASAAPGTRKDRVAAQLASILSDLSGIDAVLPRRNGELRGARVRLAVPHAGECPVPEAVRRADHLPPAVRGGAVHRYAAGVHRLEACARRAARAGTGAAGGRGRPGRRGGSGRDRGARARARAPARRSNGSSGSSCGSWSSSSRWCGRASRRPDGLPPARGRGAQRRERAPRPRPSTPAPAKTHYLATGGQGHRPGARAAP